MMRATMGFVIASFSLVFFVGPLQLSGCSMAFQQFDLPRTFVIRAVQSGKVIPGLKTIIHTEPTAAWIQSVVAREGFTNSDGLFRVDDLAPGKYWMEIGGNTAFGTLVILNIQNRREVGAPPTREVEWLAHTSVLRTNLFSGILREQVFSMEKDGWLPGPLLPRAEIKVLDAMKKSIIVSQKLGEDSQFDFSQLKPGIYEVQIHPHSIRAEASKESGLTEKGSFALEVTVAKTSTDGPFELMVSTTGCGMSFVTRQSGGVTATK